MPLTFLAHQAPVLPLKIAFPKRFNGTALVIGSMAPDCAYIVPLLPRGSEARAMLHSVAGQFLYCLPISLALCWITIRVIALPLAAHLPRGTRFRFEDYRAAASMRGTPRDWVKAAISALVGSFTHIFWDSFTHEGGWGVCRLHYTNHLLWLWGAQKITVSIVAQHVSSLLGSIAAVCLLAYIGRRRLVQTWAAEGGMPPLPRATPASRAALLTPIALLWVAGYCISAAELRQVMTPTQLPGPYLLSTALLNSIIFAGAGLCIGCFLAGRRVGPPG